MRENDCAAIQLDPCAIGGRRFCVCPPASSGTEKF
jgi:hypothetical protein